MENQKNICLGLAPQDKSGAKDIHALNDFSQVTIGGVTYRVSPMVISQEDDKRKF